MKKILQGVLFLVVGNSGSGKDSILQGAVKNYPPNLKQLYVPKRYITRRPSETEESIAISPEDFKIMSKEGKFAFKWHIYGLDYGVPIDIDEWLRKGHPVAVNVSRTIVPKARKIYDNVKVLFIQVPFETTLKRLKERGRESEKRMKERIERAKSNQMFPDADYIINNSGQLNNAITQFLQFIIKYIKN